MSSKIRKISIGSANFGQKYTFDKIELNQKEVSRILDFAKNNRIYCIDTAEAYKKSEIKIRICIKTIQPLRCPIFFVKKGILTLSTRGAHK